MQILTNRYCYPSAKILRDELVKLTGERIFVTHRPEVIRNLCLRYGNSSPIFRGRDTNYNSPEFIRLCSSKLSTSRILTDNNILTPQFFGQGKPTEYPVLIRESLSLSGGRGIHLAQDEQDFVSKWRPGFYWTPFIQTSSEYRIHILGNQISRIFKKVRREGLEEEKFPIRNLHKGYHFSLRTNLSKFDNLKVLVENLSKFLDMKFCGLDVAWTTNKQYIVWELNSAPGLQNETTASFYAEYLAREILGR
jgi:glutathione synthase/RimK-type ligase-like ATP-grasp enzyme